MSDLNKKRSDLDEIDWTMYGRAAQSIRSELAQPEAEPVLPAEEPVYAPTAPQPEADLPAFQPEESDLSQPEPETIREPAPVSERTPAPSRLRGRREAADPAETERQLQMARNYYARRAEEAPPPPEDPEDFDDYGEEPEEEGSGKRFQSTGITVLVAALYAISVLSIAFVTATLGWRWANDLLALNKPEGQYSVTIKSGQSIHEVSEALEEYGLIEYPWLFEVFASITNKADRITSGTYELNTDMDYSALLTNMSITSSAREEVEITIPEGYTVREIFELLESMGACTVAELEESAMKDEFAYSFLEGLEQDDPYWMEGYLFPDTYQFYKNGSAKVALSKMLYNYSVKFTTEMKTRAERLGYSQQEIMVIASIIEKETDGGDQKNIASVIYNRLQTSGETQGKLQMDSTIQYALAERKEHLTDADLAIDSPYNTYLYSGLPQGTICNPGMEAIEAALYPNSTTYYFFILGNDNVHHYFQTYNEFLNFRNSLDTEESGEG